MTNVSAILIQSVVPILKDGPFFNGAKVIEEAFVDDCRGRKIEEVEVEVDGVKYYGVSFTAFEEEPVQLHRRSTLVYMDHAMIFNSATSALMVVTEENLPHLQTFLSQVRTFKGK